MDRDELIFQEYKLYAEQKENFIDRNFNTNRFYMISFVAIIFAMIFTGNVVFMSKISATLIFSLIGISVCSLWWMNVDSYNTLIKIKFANVLETIEEKYSFTVADDLAWIARDYKPSERDLLTKNYMNFINTRYKEIKRRFLEIF